jgi:hypothetical protein
MANDLGIPLRVRLHAKLWNPVGFLPPISGRRWRRVWVRYWETQGISEEQQMEWADEERSREEAKEGRA